MFQSLLDKALQGCDLARAMMLASIAEREQARPKVRAYDTSMALVTFCFGSVFGMVTVRMPSSTLAEIWSRTTSSGSV